MTRLGLLALFAMSCVHSQSDVCSDGSLCPEGTRCFPVESLGTIECVSPEQVKSCNQLAENDRCDSDRGTCFGGACLPAGCNNKRLDFGEACDDGDNNPGDGCSADCRSSEVCGNEIVDPVREVDGAFVAAELCDDGDLLGHDGCSSGCAPEVARTTAIARLPQVRISTSMVTDQAAHRVIMFGGRVSNAGLRTANDTWELAADGWSKLRPEQSPGPRAGHAMAHDGTQAVMFGGVDGALTFSDTWTFAGDRWTLVTPPISPPTRTSHAMAFLPGVGVVLFGGVNEKAEFFGDTWIFADGEWTQRTLAPSPPARADHTLTLDPVRKRLVLTTGTSGLDGRSVDTWEFDGTAWMQVAGGVDAPDVVSATATYDRVRGQVILDGGIRDTGIIGPSPTSPNTYAWNGQQWTEISNSSPLLQQHASAVDPDTGQMITFGGTRPLTVPCPNCDTVFNDTYRLEGPNWVTRPFVELTRTSEDAASLDPWRQRAVLFTTQGVTLELGAGSWMNTTTAGPGFRKSAAMAAGWVGTDPVTILFGGNAANNLRQDTWTWNGTVWTSRTSGAIPAREQHAIAYDAHRKRTVLFGGRGTNGALGDTWEWTNTGWTLVAGTAPNPRSEHAMAYDPIHEVMLVFGGKDGSSNELGDLWSLDDSGWHLLAPTTSPAPRAGAAMAWDPTRRRIVLTGGTPSSDTWEWDGTEWSFVNLDTAEPIREHAMISSPTGAGVVIIGGALETLLDSNDTIQFAYSSSGPYAACRSLVDDDEDTLAGCADPDCWATCMPACPPSASCDMAAPRCGDGVCDAPRERCGICADCPCPSLP